MPPGPMEWRGQHLVLTVQAMECAGRLPPARAGGYFDQKTYDQYHEMDAPAVFAQLTREIAAEKELRASHKNRWAEILDLPQLFIAV
jgi:hypothetical protein